MISHQTQKTGYFRFVKKINFALKKDKNFSFWISLTIVLLNKAVFCQDIKTYELLLTEIMSDPKPAVHLPEDEFIEIYNNSDHNINLSNINIQVGSKSFIPESYELKPDSFFVFWDQDIPTLKNTGDSIKILYKNKIIHSVQYKPNMHFSKFKRDGGWSLELVDFSKPCLTNNNWISSVSKSGGTPGYFNSNREELTSYPIELTSYYPKNDTQLVLFFNVPIESIETQHYYKKNNNQALINITKIDSNSIDSISIMSVKTCYDVNFDELNLKYGIPKNPRYRDIIINELLFNPDESGSDFIEVYNNSNKPFNLSKLAFSKKTNDTVFEEPFKLKKNPFLLLPKEYYVVCSDKQWLKNTFPRADNIIESKLPSMNNDSGNIVLLTSSAELIDEVSYKEDWHFKELIKHENISLEKVNPTHINIASSWTSSSFSDGYATPGCENSNFIKKEIIENRFNLKNKIISPNSDGYQDQLVIHYNLPNTHWTAKISVINSSGVILHIIHPNILLGRNGFINWNGILENKSTIKPGIYALQIGAFNAKHHEKLNKKIVFYVNGILR